MNRNPLFYGTLALILSTSSFADAKARLASFCYAREADGQIGKIEGTAAQTRLPIASVSKIATAHWSLVAKGADYRFETRFHVTAVAGTTDLFDVHIEGSRDPLFGKQSLHYAISELNKKSIKKIRTLSFDENFKFLWDVTGKGAAQGYFTPRDPLAATVIEQLRAEGSLTSGYASTVASAKARGVQLVPAVAFTVKEIKHVKKADFKDAAETKVYGMKSSPLTTLLKEMNRNSNNHAANQIFEHMGGQSAYPTFIKDRLGLETKDIRFLNGSGDRYMTETGKVYNEASCEAMVKIIHDMRMELRKNAKGLHNVMAVTGGDPSATVHMYDNDVTSESVIAKTGTINTDITLAGLVLSKKGNFYFLYNIATDGAGDWSSARALIRQKLTQWVRELGGGAPMSYQQIQFMSFDAGSNMMDVQTIGTP